VVQTEVQEEGICPSASLLPSVERWTPRPRQGVRWTPRPRPRRLRLLYSKNLRPRLGPLQTLGSRS